MPTKKETIELRFDTSSDKWGMRLGGTGPFNYGPNYPVLKVDEDQVGVFTFTIIGSSGRDFADTDAFVPKGNGMPDFADQFLVFGEGTRELTVIDLNEAAGGGSYAGGNYRYELHFDKEPPLDPIITNNGCCKFLSQGEAIAYSIAVAAVIPLAIISYRRWQSKRATRPRHKGLEEF